MQSRLKWLPKLDGDGSWRVGKYIVQCIIMLQQRCVFLFTRAEYDDVFVIYIIYWTFSRYSHPTLLFIVLYEQRHFVMGGKKKLKTKNISFLIFFRIYFIISVYCIPAVNAIFCYVPHDQYILQVIFHEESHYIIIICNNILHRTVCFVRLIGFILSLDIRADV